MVNSLKLIESKEVFGENKLYTLKVDEIYIHSKYYPLEEAKKNIEARKIEKRKCVGVLGIGLGYHIYEILKQNKDCIVYVFDILSEYEKQILYSNEFLKKVIGDNRVKINISSNYEKIICYLNENLPKCDEFIILKSYMKMLKQKNSTLYDIFMEFESQRITNIKYKKELDYNILNNELLNMKSMTEFYSTYMKNVENVFLIAAGPSLNDCGEYLKEVAKEKNNFIISVGTAIGTLKKQGVYPNAICILDPLEVIYKQLEPINNSQIPLLVAYSGSHRAAKEYNGPKYIYYNYKKDNNIAIECTNSVATAALSIAINAKPKKIFFIGQDLAYVDNKVHSDNTINGDEHNHIKSDYDFVIKDVFGKDIYTSKFYLDIKKWIERTIKVNKHIQFINCSRGAAIEGCQIWNRKI